MRVRVDRGVTFLGQLGKNRPHDSASVCVGDANGSFLHQHFLVVIQSKGNKAMCVPKAAEG